EAMAAHKQYYIRNIRLDFKCSWSTQCTRKVGVINMSEPKIMFNEIMHLGGKDMAIIYLENGEGTISKYNLGNARRIDDKRAVINSLCIEDYPIINITTFKGKGQ